MEPFSESVPISPTAANFTLAGGEVVVLVVEVLVVVLVVDVVEHVTALTLSLIHI